MSLEQCLTDNI